MVTREVPLVGTKSLLYSWRNLSLLCNEFNIASVDELGRFFQSRFKTISMDDIEKMVWIGLQRKDKEVSLEEARDILEEFLEEKYIPDLIEIVIRAQVASIMVTDSGVPGESTGEVKGETKKPPKQSKNSST
jgi:hypothetical protein